MNIPGNIAAPAVGVGDLGAVNPAQNASRPGTPVEAAESVRNAPVAEKSVAQTRGVKDKTVRDLRAESASAERAGESEFGESGPGVLENLVEGLGSLLDSLNTNLKLEVDRDSHRVVVKVVDPETKEVIKQIPPEEMLRVSKRIREIMDDYSNAEKNIASIFEDSKTGV